MRGASSAAPVSGNGAVARARRLEAGAERHEAPVDADLAAADRRLEGRAREGERGGARERAEQHRAHHAAGRFRDRRHVEGDQLPGGVAAGGEQRGRVGAAVGERDLLGHREHPMGGGDQQRPVGRDEAALDRARRLHQLGGEHHVDVARHRQEPQHRLAPGRLGGDLRKQLDVIDGGAGALGDAGHRRGLRQIAAVLRQIDDPVRQHAAAFAAERNHGDGDRPDLGNLSVHRPVQAAARRRSMRRCSQPMTAPRTLSLRRSQRVGLAMIEAR